MSKHYAEMRETVEWEKSQGVSEYPGMGTFDAAIEIAARKDQSIVAIAEDRLRPSIGLLSVTESTARRSSKFRA
jgi:hypothetical protein